MCVCVFGFGQFDLNVKRRLMISEIAGLNSISNGTLDVSQADALRTLQDTLSTSQGLGNATNTSGCAVATPIIDQLLQRMTPSLYSPTKCLGRHVTVYFIHATDKIYSA